MQIKSNLRLLAALMLALLFTSATSFGQAAPQKVYSEVYYHKIKPGHTMAEARTFENEFKKVHQVQANDGSILGWYMLTLDMTTNPNKEYSYITIKNVVNPGYVDHSYPEAAMKKGWGADLPKKIAELTKQSNEIKEVVKVELWEHLAGGSANPLPSPDKMPIWITTDYKIKNGQYEEYMAMMKKAAPFYRERTVTGGAAAWTFAGLLFPWASEKGYDFSSVLMYPNMKDYLDSFADAKAETAFKKTLPGIDYKQFFKEMAAMRGVALQEQYYLMEYAVKGAATASK